MAKRRRSAATEEEKIESTSVVEADLANLEKSTVPALGESDVVTGDASGSSHLPYKVIAQRVGTCRIDQAAGLVKASCECYQLIRTRMSTLLPKTYS